MTGHILVPIDGSEHSWKAYEYAIDEHPDDHLTVVHVINPMRGDYEPNEASTQAVRRSEHLEQEVREHVDAADFDDKQIDIVTREGRPADEIIAMAENDEIDQVVMGSRGLSGVKRLLLGSVAETVVRRADVPVNVVR
jgi:Universal stress protein UspA and related nucleotide-binding proteins